ncbi:MAG: universal stress protein [Propionibacteriaceae bacterium]|jgi:nucleotide-binding universal stress UspA family protein
MAVAQFVVGVDGSEPSLQALQWAIAESGRHTAKLVAITTWTALPPPVVSPYVDVSEMGNRTDALSAAEQALKDVLEDALANHLPVAVQIVATEGHPAKILIEHSRNADLLVVGARGRGSVAGWLLGSVSQEVLRHASCPVAVVRSPYQAEEATNSPPTYPGEWSRVIVGIDGSESSKSALRWAADEAVAHDAELTVASVWTPLPIAATPYDSGGWGAGIDPQELAAAILQDTVEEVLSEHSGLALRREVSGGNAARVLIDLSDGADVLVVGSRGRGGFVGMLLGSVSQHVAAHADCTVVVVR